MPSSYMALGQCALDNVHILLCYSVLVLHAESTLTCSNVLEAVKSVHVGMGKHYAYRLESCLITPDVKTEELRVQYPEEQDYKEQIIKHWLKTSPHATWEDLGRELLLYGQKRAFDKVKRYIKPLTGTLTCTSSYSQTTFQSLLQILHSLLPTSPNCWLIYQTLMRLNSLYILECPDPHTAIL